MEIINFTQAAEAYKIGTIFSEFCSFTYFIGLGVYLIIKILQRDNNNFFLVHIFKCTVSLV
jgi:hypothetical protein